MTSATMQPAPSPTSDALAVPYDGPMVDPPSAKIVIVLPAFNEAEALGPLLAGVQRDMVHSNVPYEVVVVDDGSSDETALVASQASFAMPVDCIQHVHNQGLAAALRTGLLAALDRTGPGDVIITMDADNTHPPGSITRMFSMIREGRDVVIASRYQAGSRVCGVPLHRNALSYGARFLFTLLFPIRGVRDYTCGYRAYRHEVLRQGVDYYGEKFISEQGFSCMVDVLLKLRRFRPIMGEAPLVLRYDQKGGVSKMRVARTVVQTLRLMARRRLGQK